MNEIKGSFWIKKSNSGSFYTGNIEIDGEKINCVMFQNEKKTNDKQPDFKIMKAREYEKTKEKTSQENIPF